MVTFDFFIIFALTRRLRVKRENIDNVCFFQIRNIYVLWNPLSLTPYLK